MIILTSLKQSICLLTHVWLIDTPVNSNHILHRDLDNREPSRQNANEPPLFVQHTQISPPDLQVQASRSHPGCDPERSDRSPSAPVPRHLPGALHRAGPRRVGRGRGHARQLCHGNGSVVPKETSSQAPPGFRRALLWPKIPQFIVTFPKKKKSHWEWGIFKCVFVCFVFNYILGESELALKQYAVYSVVNFLKTTKEKS